jgi:hypothetical protein
VVRYRNIDKRKYKEHGKSDQNRLVRANPRRKICNRKHIWYPRNKRTDQDEFGMLADRLTTFRLTYEEIRYKSKNRD